MKKLILLAMLAVPALAQTAPTPQPTPSTPVKTEVAERVRVKEPVVVPVVKKKTPLEIKFRDF